MAEIEDYRKQQDRQAACQITDPGQTLISGNVELFCQKDILKGYGLTMPRKEPSNHGGSLLPFSREAGRSANGHSPRQDFCHRARV